MIIINLKGGLGNQMFQYAFGRYLSIKNNDLLKLDIIGINKNSKDTKRKFSLNIFNVEADIAEDSEVKKLKYPFGIISKFKRLFDAKILRKFYISFHPELLSLKGDIYLDGFFQCEKYFTNIKDIILKEFTLKEPFSKSAEKIHSAIKNSPNSVSVHIRRGDYTLPPNTSFGTCSIEYYEKAISTIKERIQSPAFFVFSDDIVWVKENLKIESAIFISDPEIRDKDYEELVLMSNCNHHIIANSTFSWWGAWLNPNCDKIVIAPKQWTTRKTADELDILPKTWIQI